MAAKTAGDLKDPNLLWEVFKSVFKNLMVAKGSECDKYLNSVSQMVSSFPQILVGTSTWPDTRIELATKRNVFTAALVRRVVHVVAGRRMEEEMGGCMVVMEAIFSIMIDTSPAR